LCPDRSRETLEVHRKRECPVSPDERWFPSHLREIDRAECLELVAAHEVGRIAYCDDQGPVVLPVNYSFDGDTILIQVSPHSALAAHLRDEPASLQIDYFEDYSQSGWSVLVRGEASYVDAADLPGSEGRPHTWAEGQRTLHVRITPHDVSGRRLLPA
jgi:nitroimidazol reductase NimA-like FMN-containing flavoprotein (pyridoxamine 5'-phosphate oxidase superfamily)